MTSSSQARMKVYIDATLHARVREAFLDADRRRYPNLSTFVVTAVLRYVVQTEREHNAGRPWPPAEPGELRLNPRVGENPDVKKKDLQFYLEAGHAARFRGAAKGMDKPMSDIVAKALTEALDNPPEQTPPGPPPGHISRGRPLDLG